MTEPLGDVGRVGTAELVRGAWSIPMHPLLTAKQWNRARRQLTYWSLKGASNQRYVNRFTVNRDGEILAIDGKPVANGRLNG